MTKKSINVIGIMIDAEYKDFKLYHMDESWEKSTQDATYSSQSTSGNSWAEGLEDIIEYLSIPPEPDANTQFVIVYDVSCPNKEEHIKKLLSEINKIKKDDLLPALISIRHEHSPWNEDITGQVSIIKEVENTGARNDLFKNIIRQELYNIKKEPMATDKADELLKRSAVKSSQMQEENSSSMSNISMMVLGGFIAAAGIAAVAIAFAVLNATTFGIAGLVVAGIGVAAALSGVGLFATGAYKNKNTHSDISLDQNHSNNIVPI